MICKRQIKWRGKIYRKGESYSLDSQLKKEIGADFYESAPVLGESKDSVGSSPKKVKRRKKSN